MWWLLSFNYQTYNGTLWFSQIKRQGEGTRFEKWMKIYIYSSVCFELLTSMAQVANWTSHAGLGFVPAGNAILSLLWPRASNTTQLYTHLAASSKQNWGKPTWKESQATCWVIWMQQHRVRTIQNRIQRQCGLYTVTLCNKTEPKWFHFVILCQLSQLRFGIRQRNCSTGRSVVKPTLWNPGCSHWIKCWKKSDTD